MRKQLVSAVAGVLLISAPLSAQELRGLDAAGDEALVQELARYGMDNLLERYFQTSQTSAQQQASVRAMMSIRALLVGGESMSTAQRQMLVKRIVDGAETIVPSLRDPRQLMQLASALITGGMERSANTIEYWGENPRSQAEIRPVAELVARVLDACQQRAREQAEKLVASFGNNPAPAQLKEYTSLDNLATTAQYTRFMADYYRAMAYPKGDPKRSEIAEAAIEGLREYDSGDSQIQPLVRLRIGKLQMVQGDYAAAKATLLSVATNPNAEIDPAPDGLQQYEARYFSVVCDVLSRNADMAAKSIVALGAWQDQNLPQEKATRDGAGASLAMLRYRLEMLKAELASSAEGKTAAQESANAVLQQLAKDRPELRGVIYGQLVKSVAEDAPVKTLDTLMLKALVQQGVAEQLKSDGNAFDQKAVERAISACQEIISRAGTPGTDADVADDASIVLPQLHEKLGRDAEAADAYLRYVRSSKNPANRMAAMQNLLAAIGRITAADAQSPAAQKLLDQSLPIAVKEFGRKDLAFDLGRRLQQQGKHAEAIEAFAAVPRDDRRVIVADFYRMQSMKQQLDGSDAKSDSRRTLADAIGKLAEQLQGSATAAAGTGTDPEKLRYRLIAARARLMSANLAKESDPARAVQVLDGFEASLQGVPAADDLEAEALFLRIHSLMGMGRNAEATQSLLQLLQTRAGDEGAAIIFSLLTKLDADLEHARKSRDTAKTKSLLDARAALSGPLVTWAKDNKEERIRKYAYRYMVFDASTTQQAAMVESDPAKRVKRLREALALYDKLLDREGIKLWGATVDAAKVDVQYGDVTVLFAKAQVLYQLAEYKEAAARFARLLEDRKLGMPRIITTRDGEVVAEDNPQYWEATWTLYSSNVELANNPATPDRQKLLDDTKNGLKRLYIREGDGVGGEKWKSEFTKLRQQLIPEFRLDMAASGQ